MNNYQAFLLFMSIGVGINSLYASELSCSKEALEEEKKEESFDHQKFFYIVEFTLMQANCKRWKKEKKERDVQKEFKEYEEYRILFEERS